MVFLFYILILLISSLLSLSFPFLPNIQQNLVKDDNDTSLDDLLEATQVILGEIIKQSTNISQNCSNNLTQAFICSKKDNDDCINRIDITFYINKLIADTSKNQNDITSYSQCIRKNDQDYTFNISYVVVIIDHKVFPIDFTNLTFISRWGIFGLCLPQLCNEEEIKTLIYNGVVMFNNVLDLQNEEEIDVYFVNPLLNKIKWSDYEIYLGLLPGALILLQLIIIFTGCLPCDILKCCNRKAKLVMDSNSKKNTGLIFNFIGVNLSNSHSSLLDNTSIPLIPPTQTQNQIQTQTQPHRNKSLQFIDSNIIKTLFDLSYNAEELFNFQPTTNLNNLSCLTCLAGIRGISMLFFIFGSLFFALVNSASGVFFETLFINLMETPIFSMFYFGIRYSPKILLSCSGYSLFFKFVCFLDDEFDQVKDMKFLIYQEKLKEKQKKSAMINMNQGSNNIMAKEDSLSVYDEFTERQFPEDIYLSFLLKFGLYQIHKYLLYVLMLLFMDYSLHYLFLLFKEPNPMWNYFQRDIINFNTTGSSTDILKGIALLDPFLYRYGLKDQSLFKYSWFVLCEIKYFVISSIMIFIGYKFKMRFDLFVIALVFLLFIAKIVVFYLKFSKQKYYSTLFYFFTDYGSINFGFLWNYIYYLLGILFGCINYVIQKDLSINEIVMIEKRYLIRGAYIVKFFKDKKKQIVLGLGLLGLVIIALFSFALPITLHWNKVQDSDIKVQILTGLQQSPLMNYFMLIDTDIIVLLVHFSAFLFYIKGDNSITKFLSHSIWFILNKFYFSFVLLLNPVILYVLYQSESRINLNIFNNFLYSFTCAVIIFIFASANYICFELPWKRVIKTIVKRRFEENNSNLKIKNKYQSIN